MCVCVCVCVCVVVVFVVVVVVAVAAAVFVVVLVADGVIGNVLCVYGAGVSFTHHISFTIAKLPPLFPSSIALVALPVHKLTDSFTFLAKVTATSETATADIDGRAINVISGQSRALVYDGGVPPSQGINGTNRWISTSVPAAVSLELAAPTAVAQV